MSRQPCRTCTKSHNNRAGLDACERRAEPKGIACGCGRRHRTKLRADACRKAPLTLPRLQEMRTRGLAKLNRSLERAVLGRMPRKAGQDFGHHLPHAHTERAASACCDALGGTDA